MDKFKIKFTTLVIITTVVVYIFSITLGLLGFACASGPSNLCPFIIPLFYFFGLGVVVGDSIQTHSDYLGFLFQLPWAYTLALIIVKLFFKKIVKKNL